MKFKIIIAMILVLFVIGCGKEEEEVPQEETDIQNGSFSLSVNGSSQMQSNSRAFCNKVGSLVKLQFYPDFGEENQHADITIPEDLFYSMSGMGYYDFVTIDDKKDVPVGCYELPSDNYAYDCRNVNDSFYVVTYDLDFHSTLEFAYVMNSNFNSVWYDEEKFGNQLCKFELQKSGGLYYGGVRCSLGSANGAKELDLELDFSEVECN